MVARVISLYLFCSGLSILAWDYLRVGEINKPVASSYADDNKNDGVEILLREKTDKKCN